MGLSASSDEWCKRSDAALSGILGVHKLVDDILIEGSNYMELLERLETVLKRCVESNITISLEKMQIGDSVILLATQFLPKVSIPSKKELMQSEISQLPLTKLN